MPFQLLTSHVTSMCTVQWVSRACVLEPSCLLHPKNDATTSAVRLNQNTVMLCNIAVIMKKKKPCKKETRADEKGGRKF